MDLFITTNKPTKFLNIASSVKLYLSNSLPVKERTQIIPVNLFCRLSSGNNFDPAFCAYKSAIFHNISFQNGENEAALESHSLHLLLHHIFLHICYDALVCSSKTKTSHLCLHSRKRNQQEAFPHRSIHLGPITSAQERGSFILYETVESSWEQLDLPHTSCIHLGTVSSSLQQLHHNKIN